MAISEVSLRDAVQMAVDQNVLQGGVLGKKIEPVIVDPASDWDLFAEKSKELLMDKKVAAVFGCWTSVSRKSVLPVFRREQRFACSIPCSMKGRGELKECSLLRRHP